MAESVALTEAFIERYPESAASVLVTADPAETAGLLDAVPPAVAARVLACTGSWPAARALRCMTPAAAVGVLAGMGDVDAAAVLRIIDPAERQPILDAAPARLRRQMDFLLDYPPGTVGAHMTTSIVMISEDTSAAAALKAVRGSRAAVVDVFFVVAPTTEPLGAVSAAALLQAPASAALGTIADRAFPVLPARTSLVAAATDELWRDYHVVGIVNRRRCLVGALTRRTLDAFARDVATRPVDGDASLLGAMSGAMVESLGGLWRLIGEVESDTSPPSGSE